VKRPQDDNDFDSEEERAVLEKDKRESRVNKKSVHFNIKSNVERLKKQKLAVNQAKGAADGVDEAADQQREAESALECKERRQSSRLINKVV